MRLRRNKKRVLGADRKNLKGGGFDSLWDEVCEKAPVSDLTAATIQRVKMLCHTACCTYCGNGNYKVAKFPFTLHSHLLRKVVT